MANKKFENFLNEMIPNYEYYISSNTDMDNINEKLYYEMIDFILDIYNNDNVIDEMSDIELNNIEYLIQEININLIDDEENYDDVNEALTIRRKRRDKILKRKRRQEYLKTKAQVKQKAKRYRKTASYKQYTRKKKKLSKFGKTSTGKRISKWIN